MPRPKLTERITLRLPVELLADLTAAASRRGVSLNEVALCCFENDLARIGTYQLDYYDEFRPLVIAGQGDIGGRLSRMSDTICDGVH